MKVRVEQIGAATLYLGDCRDLLPIVKGVDRVVTDPPYGVGLGTSKHGNARRRMRGTYTCFEDTRTYVQTCAVPAIEYCVETFTSVVLTPGQRNAWLYPEPDDVGTWFNPGGSSAGKWGWLTGHLIFYYGRDPRAGGRITASSVTGFGPVKTDRAILHPCPKPKRFAEWLVNKASLEGETVLDPFMGSGTFGVASLEQGRAFVGLEIDPQFFDVACRRIEATQNQLAQSTTLGEPQ